MGWMEFISSVVGSLAWPVCIAVIVLLLRRGLVNMLASGPLKTLKAGPTGFEMEFDRTLSDAKVNVGLPADRSKPSLWRRLRGKQEPEAKFSAPETGEDTDMDHLATLSPTAAILESFGRLEKALRDKVTPIFPRRIRPDGTVAPMSGSIRALALFATEEGILTEAEAKSLRELSTLRDALAHGEGRHLVDREQALSFNEVAERLIKRIENATVPPRNFAPSATTSNGGENQAQ